MEDLNSSAGEKPADEIAGAPAAPKRLIYTSPFERGFPPLGGAELTRSYLPALKRAIAQQKLAREGGEMQANS